MRIKISDDSTRKYFFDLVKNNYDCTWKKIRRELNLSRASLDRYKSGRNLIPEDLFLKFINMLENHEKNKILQNIKKFQDNFGKIKGGKKAYSINVKKFEEGRIKGMFIIQNNIKNQKRIYIRKIKKIKKEYIFNSNLTSDICEFIGAFIGDGFFNCYNNKNYQIEFSGDSRKDVYYYQDVIIPIIKKTISNLRPHMYFDKSKNILRVRFYSKELFYFLKECFGFIPGKKTHTVRIPREIVNSSSDLIYATIKGIFDTDGGVFIDKRKTYNKPYPRIVFQTVSNPLYNQLVYYLSKEFKIYSRYNPNRKIYVIEIYGHNQIKKWMSLIGFSNKRHLDKIASVA